MNKYFEDSILNEMYATRHLDYENFIKKNYEIEEEKYLYQSEKGFKNIIKKFVKDEKDYNQISNALTDFEVAITDRNEFWKRIFYIAGHIDANKIKSELNQFADNKEDKLVTKARFENDIVDAISDLVENKMHELKTIKDFEEKDGMLSSKTEMFENKLSKELEDDFDDLMRITYEVEQYYFVLAYYIGKNMS